MNPHRLLCSLGFHDFLPSNPMLHDFEGRVCACGGKEIWKRNPDTQFRHYEFKRVSKLQGNIWLRGVKNENPNLDSST